MKVTILSRDRFIDKVLPKVDELDSEKYFFISIMEPEDKEPLKENSYNYKTFSFMDLDYDINQYKAITFEQSEEIRKFILEHKGKHLFVHCHAGIARSGAVGEFYYELLGGSYSELLKTFPCILPNPRVLQYLRMGQKSEDRDYSKLKINFS